MEEVTEAMKSPDSMELSVVGSNCTFLVTHEAVVAVDSLSQRLEEALRLCEDAAFEGSVRNITTDTRSDFAVVRPVYAVVDERLFWSTIVELSRSCNYRRLCFSKLRSKCRNCQFTKCFKSGSLFVKLAVQLAPWKPVMDMPWEARIGCLVREQLELDNTMAWLSTLGGAFSALGDYNPQFAEAASQVSLRQLQLAMHLGDPVVVCRCRLYLAMSLLQRGNFRCCRTLLRRQYQFAISKEGQRDPKLVKMCQSVWVRMRYLSSLRKTLSNKVF